MLQVFEEAKENLATLITAYEDLDHQVLVVWFLLEWLIDLTHS